jgi:hypothetical protein
MGHPHSRWIRVNQGAARVGRPRRSKEEDLPAFCEIACVDVNQVGDFDERPLHAASSRGNMEETAALVGAGAEVNAHRWSRQYSAGRSGRPGPPAGHPIPCSITGHLLTCAMSLERRRSIRQNKPTGATSLMFYKLGPVVTPDRSVQATESHSEAEDELNHCGCMTSSTTTLPPLSAVMTLCTGAYPLSVMSIT